LVAMYTTLVFEAEESNLSENQNGSGRNSLENFPDRSKSTFGHKSGLS